MDFLVTFLLADVFNCWYVAANAAGNITGAIAQFILSRNWVFAAARQPVPAQLIKFVLMWVGNIVLSALFVYLITHYLQVHYLLSKLFVSVLLGISYTYLLSKKFVFT